LDENKKGNKSTLDLSQVVFMAWMRARKSSIDPKLLQLMLLRKTRRLQDTQKREHKAAKEPGFSRNNQMILKATQISKKENSEEKVLLQMLQNLQDSQLARGLLYFINYHIHDYKTSETAPKHLRDRSSTLMAQLPLITDRKKAS
jgi:hypothetical protein